MKDDSCCIVDNNTDLGQYWDSQFEKSKIQNWSELESPAINSWIGDLSIPRDTPILCAGVGESKIVENLLDLEFTNIIANDISEIALNKLKSRIKSSKVTYIKDDLISPSQLQNYYGKVGLYIDRATLHFFTKCEEKDTYFNQLNQLLMPQGISMIGVFSKNNRPKCCGLDLQLWSLDSLKKRLKNHSFLGEFEQDFVELNQNVRNYIYLMSQKPKA